MNIDMNKFKRHWFEDADGNAIAEEDRDAPGDIPEDARYYHSCFPCQISHKISSYDYHPKGVIQKVLSKVPVFEKILIRIYGKTFKSLGTFYTTYGGYHSQETILGMVTKGGYTLEQAIWAYTSACERCMNVLIYRYGNKNDGYEEFSEEWCKCGTVCGFCREGEK